jgi:hypothetical protein
MADSNSTVQTDQSSSGTAAQQSAAQSTESQAGVGVGGANAGAGAEGRLAQEETVADIGQIENYISDLAFTSKRINANAIDFDQQMKSIALQSLQNAVNLANRIQSESISNDVRARDNSGTHDKNVDTISEGLLAAQPFFQDLAETIALKIAAKLGVKTTA